MKINIENKQEKIIKKFPENTESGSIFFFNLVNYQLGIKGEQQNKFYIESSDNRWSYIQRTRTFISENIQLEFFLLKKQLKSKEHKMDYVVDNNLLNDDCVLEIFEELSLKSLIKVAQVSIQFNRLAQIIFSKKYRTFIFDELDISQAEILIVLDIFGHLIRKLTLEPKLCGWHNVGIQNGILKAIEKNCSGDMNNLKSLELHDFYANSTFHLLKNAFKCLEKFTINFVTVPYPILHLLNRLPMLKELKMIEPLLTPNSITMGPTIATLVNPNLEKLYLECYSFEVIDFIPTIDICYPNLKELTLRLDLPFFQTFSEVHLYRIANLKLLTKLDLDVETLDISILLGKLVENGVKLKSLQLRRIRHFKEAITHLCKQREIEELFSAFAVNLSIANIFAIASNLPKLRKLSIMNNEITTIDLMNILNSAENLTELELQLTPDSVIYTHDYMHMRIIVNKRQLDKRVHVIVHKVGQYSVFEVVFTKI